MRQLTPLMIRGFSEGILNSRYDNPQPTPDFHDELWKLCCSERRKVAIAAPRGHAKSTAVTLAYALASILFKNKKFVLIISDTEDQAASFLQNIASELIDNEALIEYFGPTLFKGKRGLKDSYTKIIGEFKGGDRFCVMAKGSGQSLRGCKWLNKRPDLIIGDDLENDDIVMTSDAREKFRNWVMKVVLPMMGDFGQIRIIGTILHMDSYLERLMPENQLPKRFSKARVDSYIHQGETCTHSTYPKASWLSVRYKAHNPDYSDLLWASKFPKDRLEEIYQEYVDQDFSEGYAQEYLNYPIDESKAFYKRSWFKPIENYGKEPLNYYIGSDFGATQKAKSDPSVFVVVGINSEGILKIVNVIKDKMDGLDIEMTFHALQRQYEPEAFFVEKGTIWNMIKPGLERSMFEQQRFMNIVGIPSTADKMSRGKPLQARMRMGAVEVMKDEDWYQAYEDEFARFPRDVHDDQVDATSIIALGIQQMVNAPTVEELQNEEYEYEMDEYEEDNSLGFNVTGGY